MATERTKRGQYDGSRSGRIAFVALRLFDVAVQALLLFGGAQHFFELFLKPVPRTASDTSRFLLLIAFGLIAAVRQSYHAIFLMRESFPIENARNVAVYNFVYDTVLSLCAVRQSQTEFSWMQWTGIVLFAVGSFLETSADLQRKWFKDTKENDGKLLTAGLYQLCQNPNYFGYMLWRFGFGLATGSYVAAVFALHNLPDFLMVSIPQKERYMQEHYGKQYVASGFNKRAKLIPFVY